MKLLTKRLVAGALAIVGTSTCAAIYLAALTSKDPRRGKPATVSIADLEVGRFMVLDAGAFRYFIIRPETGDLYVVASPVEAGEVPMPEVHWWKPMMTCKDFALDATAGIVRPESRFRCRDADQPEEWAPRWQWDIGGRHVPAADGMQVTNMYRVRIERDDDDITFVGLDSD